MKVRHYLYAAAALVLAGAAGTASARGDVSVHFGVSTPGVAVGVSSGGYYHPAPVYYPPAPVYYQPAPVYVRPAPVYYAPPPVYYRPAPVYFGATYHHRHHHRGHGHHRGHRHHH